MNSSPSNQKENSQPFISAEKNLPEITVKSVLLSIFLAIILSAANAYLGLFAGMTVSASIPAAVISMALLRLFKNSNILENNIVQTATSAGESLAAGVIFTIPALILLKAWAGFNYLETTLIAGFGGILGVLFSIPLRRALVTDKTLKFPEGLATAEVLKIGDQGGGGVKYLAISGLIGAGFKLGETGFRLWHGAIEWGKSLGGSVVYFGSSLSPALASVGYIVGLNIAILIFIGGFFNWYIAIPIISGLEGGVPDGANPVGHAFGIWSTKTRYLGVGAMVVGGLWALISMRKQLIQGIKSGLQAYISAKKSVVSAVLRTEKDAPMQWIGIALIFSLIPLFFIFKYFTGDIFIASIMSIVMLVAGFLFSAVAAYMAGLVGSSNNPISGVTIATILMSSLLLLLLMGSNNSAGPAAAILIGSVVCCAAAISGDNLQDLKSGQILGATPYKQQIMQVVGVLSAAAVMAPTLSLIQMAYGIGEKTAEFPNALPAPQANLMASVAQGVFKGGLPWDMVFIGMVLAVIVIIIDKVLESKNSQFRTPVLAVAVGIYLPFELAVPILFGGLIAHFSNKFFSKAKKNSSDKDSVEQQKTESQRNGLLFAAGLITGEALVGILMAIPIVVTGNKNVLAIFGSFNHSWPGAFLLGLVLLYMFKVSTKSVSAVK